MGYLDSFDKKECFGCRACEEICPKKAIKFKTDDEGFFYPEIDTDNCIRCKLCEKACPHDYERWIPREEIKAYYGYADENTVFNSSSGGAFTALYSTLLKEGYHVYGVKFGEDFQVIHDCADSIQGCEEFRKSKYVQSNTNHAYSKIEEQLKKNEKVLFSGTPCQNAALLQYLTTKHIDKTNLITISLLCHGVPNQQIFDTYINKLERKGGKIKEYSFRHKILDDGKYNSRTAKIVYESGREKIVEKSEDIFLKGYYNRLFYRPSCYSCIFARNERVSDFTIADAWKIDSLIPGLDPLKGISLLLIHSKKAYALMDEISKNAVFVEIDQEWAMNSQAIMHRPTAMHKNRNLFFELYKKRGLQYAIWRCTWNPNIRIWLGSQKRKLKKMLSI